VDYGRVIRFKLPLLRAAYERFKTNWKSATSSRISAACASQWLDDYALFMALKAAHGGEAVWSRWEPAIAARKPAALKEWREAVGEDIEALEFAQYMFFRQWRSLHNYAARPRHPHHGRPAHLRGAR
jgi:4-alpha-glucanotransferase